MARSRVRKTAKVKKTKERLAQVKARSERRKRINELEGWYNELDQIENQAIANLVDRAAVEESVDGEQEKPKNQPDTDGEVPEGHDPEGDV